MYPDNERYSELVSEYQDGQTAYNLKEKMLKDAVFMRMRAELVSKFTETSYKEESERTEIWRKMQVVEWFDGILTQITNDGKLAEEELSRFDRFKNYVRGKTNAK